MGIDGIGNKGPVPPAPAGATTGAPRATGVDRAFEVSRPAAAPPADVTRSALDRLEAGEIDVNGYVDAKVHEATAHLGALSPERLAEIRAALRERVAADPTLVELVRSAAGSVASPPRDD